MAVLKNNTGNVAGVAKFGGSSGIRQRTASKFVPTANWLATDIDIRINEDTGNPTGDVQVGIFTDSAGVPSSTQVGGFATVTAASISGSSFQDFNRSFSSSATLTNGTTYWIVFMVASGQSDANYYSSRAITTAAAGNGAQYNEPTPATWTNNTDDLYYSLNGSIITESGFLMFM